VKDLPVFLAVLFRQLRGRICLRGWERGLWREKLVFVVGVGARTHTLQNTKNQLTRRFNFLPWCQHDDWYLSTASALFIGFVSLVEVNCSTPACLSFLSCCFVRNVGSVMALHGQGDLGVCAEIVVPS